MNTKTNKRNNYLKHNSKPGTQGGDLTKWIKSMGINHKTTWIA